MHVHTVAKSNLGGVCSEVDSVLATAETKVQDAKLTALEILVNPGMDLAKQSVNASSWQNIEGVVTDQNQ